MGFVEYSVKLADNYRDDYRLERQDEALAAYDGTLPKPMKTLPDEPDDTIQVNYVDTVVDKITSFLFGKPVGIQIGTEQIEDADTYLEMVWPQDQRNVDLINLGTNGALFGHAWCKIMITDQLLPRVVVQDPMNWTAEYSPDDIRLVTKYICQYRCEDAQGRPMIKREEIVPDGKNWKIIYLESHTESSDRPRWINTGEQPWPYSFPPVFECQNLPKACEFYGKPDVSHTAIQIMKCLHRLDTFINKTIRNYADPKPIAKGMRAQDLKPAINKILFLPDKDQSIEYLEMTGNVEGALQFRAELRDDIELMTHCPLFSARKVESLGTLSGRAMRILYSPLIQRTEAKHMLYGPMLVRLVKALLLIGKKGDLPVSLLWPEMLPDDPKETTEILTVHQSLGIVSKKTTAEKLGYNWEKEQDQMLMEAEEQKQQAGMDANYQL